MEFHNWITLKILKYLNPIPNIGRRVYVYTLQIERILSQSSRTFI